MGTLFDKNAWNLSVLSCDQIF